MERGLQENFGVAKEGKGGCRGAGKLRRLRWFPAPLQRIGGEAADSPNKR